MDGKKLTHDFSHMSALLYELSSLAIPLDEIMVKRTTYEDGSALWVAGIRRRNWYMFRQFSFTELIRLGMTPAEFAEGEAKQIFNDFETGLPALDRKVP